MKPKPALLLSLFALLLTLAVMFSGCQAAGGASASASQPGVQASSAPSPASSGPSLTYQQNDTTPSYDEILFWADEMAEYMSGEKYESLTDLDDGTVETTYSHASILWTGHENAHILKLDITQANLACPRGVFLGNPTEKMDAYYPAFSGKPAGSLYFEQAPRMGRDAWRYGLVTDDGVVYAALAQNTDESYTELRLQYTLQDGKVTHIVYTMRPTLTAEEAQALLAVAQGG